MNPNSYNLMTYLERLQCRIQQRYYLTEARAHRTPVTPPSHQFNTVKCSSLVEALNSPISVLTNLTIAHIFHIKAHTIPTVVHTNLIVLSLVPNSLLIVLKLHPHMKMKHIKTYTIKVRTNLIQ